MSHIILKPSVVQSMTPQNTQPFHSDCAQCLEDLDMCSGYEDCYLDCGSPCKEGGDCNLPEACYDQHCQTDLCEDQNCAAIPYTTAPCNDVACPEASTSIDTTCFDPNCLGNLSLSTFAFTHTAPQTCPPGQCQGFAPCHQLNGQGHQHPASHPVATISELPSPPIWAQDPFALQSLSYHSDYATTGAIRGRKRRRIEGCGSGLANTPGTASTASVDHNWHSNLCDHFWGCCSASHQSASSLSNVYSSAWLNHEFHLPSAEQFGFSDGVFHNNHSLGEPEEAMGISKLEQPFSPSVASPGTLQTSSTHVTSDIIVFSEDDLLGKDSALQDFDVGAIEKDESIQSGLMEGKTTKLEEDLACRWILDPDHGFDGYQTCSKIFRNQKELDTHIKQEHVSKLNKQFTCHWQGCQSCFTHDYKHRGKLIRHIRGAHSHYHEHVCDHCGMTFCTKEQLKNHETKHTQAKPYKCSYCDHRSATKTQHNTHERTHTKIKPYHCPYCEHRSGDSSNLSKHIKNKHPDQVARSKTARSTRGPSVAAYIM